MIPTDFITRDPNLSAFVRFLNNRYIKLPSTPQELSSIVHMFHYQDNDLYAPVQLRIRVTSVEQGWQKLAEMLAVPYRTFYYLYKPERGDKGYPFRFYEGRILGGLGSE